MKVFFLFISILALILSVRYIFYFQGYTQIVSGSTFQKTTTLLENPSDSFGNQIFYVDSIRIEARPYPVLRYGDRISITGAVEKRYFTPKYSSRQISQLFVRHPNVEILEQHNPLIKAASYIRKRVYDQFLSTLPYNEAVLLFGIVFGGSEGFSSSMKDAFRNTGVLHVVAASGMNVTMVGAFLLASFSRVLGRRLALTLSILGIFYYALISGFEPSIMRASFMIAITFVAAILGRQNYGLLSLILVAVSMLFINPFILFDVGFLLSFTSTLGILVVKPFFDQIQLFKQTKFISEDVGTSFSAQIGSLPVLIGTFSTYSIISLLVNALVLWTIPFLMILGGIASFSAIALPFVSFIPLYVSLPFLWIFEKIVFLFSDFPLLVLNEISPIFFLGYYLILFSIVLMIKKRKYHES
ncbi:MAG: ComEC/Rec2 family competence protein [Candidatus Levybacteria bacterium]|nr:ComEC/Rec2 family competence protein [Candidatus Levybacteria bacterium]